MLTYLLFINVIAYAIMWIDKVKSIYKWWRISEKTLWLLALLGGGFGVWLGMSAPLYHKAGKRNFKLWIPVIVAAWMILLVFLSSKELL